MKLKKNCIEKLPYGKDFLFVDEILEISTKHILASYFFSKELGFYNSHFKHNPVTPGVILTECAAQIGLACFGMHLIEEENESANAEDYFMALAESQMQFLGPHYPDETVYVKAELIYFRFNKLKVSVEIKNTKQHLIAKGKLAGMLIKTNHINEK